MQVRQVHLHFYDKTVNDRLNPSIRVYGHAISKKINYHAIF